MRHRGRARRLVWRFLTGHHLDGQYRTDAGWMRRGRRVLHPTGHVGTWGRLSRVERAGVRLVTLTVVVAGVWGWVFHRSETVVTAATVGAVATGLVAWRVVRALRGWRHRSATTTPLWQGLRTILPDLPHAPGRVDLVVPRNYRTSESAQVRLVLPVTFTSNPGIKTAVTDLVTARLGGEWDTSWTEHSGGGGFVTWKRREKLPEKVTFGMLREAMDSGDGSNPVIGIGSGREVIRLNIDTENPHIACSIGTGGGKSSLLKLVISQGVRHGWERVEIVDPKYVSLNVFKGVPGVTIHRTWQRQHDAIRDVRAEMDRRYEQLNDDDTRTFSRIVLVIEEGNSFAEEMRQYWQSIKAPGDPATPPVLTDLAFIAFKGRQANVNIIGVWQYLTARATGGSDVRGQFGAKILARFNVNAWNMLVGTNPRPKSSRHPGRAIVLIGDDQRQVQLGFVTDEEARDYALNGRALDVSLPASSGVIHQGGQGSPVPAQGRNADVVQLLAPSSESERYTLRQAAADTGRGVVPMKYDALKRAFIRPGAEAPSGVSVGKLRLYTATELEGWYRNRPSSRTRNRDEDTN